MFVRLLVTSVMTMIILRLQVVMDSGSDHGEGEAWLHAPHEKVPDEHGPVRHANLVTVPRVLEAQTAEHPLHVLQLGGVRPNLVSLPVRDRGEGAAATHPQLR